MFFFTGAAFVGVLVTVLAVDLDEFAVVLAGVSPVPGFAVLAGLETTGVAFLAVAVPGAVVGFEELLIGVFPVVAAADFLTGVTAGFVSAVAVGAF